MRILVTGSSGFLGTHLCRELRQRGHEVTGIDLTHAADVRCDIREFRQLEAIFNWVKPEIVYHLAAEFGRNNGTSYYEQMWSTNVLGTQNLLTLSGQTKFIFASSSEVYGSLADSEPELTEDLLASKVPVFTNEYALSKYTNEKQIEIASQRGFDAKILRFFNVYGPGEPYSPYRSVICQFIYKMLRNEPVIAYRDYWRSYLYVDDWVNMVLESLPQDGKFAEQSPRNIASMEYVNIERLVELIGNKDVTWLDSDPTTVRNKKPHIKFHRASTVLEEGIRRTIEWQRKAGLSC